MKNSILLDSLMKINLLKIENKTEQNIKTELMGFIISALSDEKFKGDIKSLINDLLMDAEDDTYNEAEYGEESFTGKDMEKFIDTYLKDLN